MITRAQLFAVFAGLRPGELEHWIAEQWVRPQRRGGEVLFDEIDVARVRLLVELRDELHVDEEALPLVLSLMDQLYAARRRMRLLCDAIEGAGQDFRDTVAAELRRRIDSGGV